MNKNVLVFLPDSLNTTENGYVKGIYKSFIDCEAFYIVSCEFSPNYSLDCIGYFGKKKRHIKSGDNFININNINGRILVKGVLVNPNAIVQITYNYEEFENSNVDDLQSDYGRHFKVLSSALKQKKEYKTQNGKKYITTAVLLNSIAFLNIILWILFKGEKMLKYSATFQHFENTILTLKTTLEKLYDKGSDPLIYNELIAKLLDLCFGIAILNFLLAYEGCVMNGIQFLIEEIISNLKDLLLYLMGSPIGLKLNYSFNKSLGQFFFYHISLWKIFLLSIKPLFKEYFKYFLIPGVFGLSFQMGMISDIISIATFHVYCIYVYAARIFNIQLKGLISLWRLFIGKKYNPLRKRVDSCQYSPNQLFIGTLGFTVLLFLLPTTIMYYTVFCMFRLIILASEEILWWSRYLLKAIPLYVFFLWMRRSSSLAGSLCMVWQNSEQDAIPKINIKLNILPLMDCIKTAMPNKPNNTKSLGTIFHCLVTGELL